MNQQEFTHNLVRALNQSTRELDAATLARLASVRHEVVRGDNHHAGHGVLTHAHRHPWLGLVMAVGLLLAGWFVVNLQKPADTGQADILLLTDDLPPNAYAEQDFSKWLKAQDN